MQRRFSSMLLTSLLMLAVPAEVLATPPAQDQEGQAYLVQSGDWLSKLAQAYFDDPLAYPSIVEATNARAAEDDSFTHIDNPDLIEVGQKLWIPAAGPAQAAGNGLSVSQLHNGSYAGIYPEPVQLTSGTYAGPPFVEGGASRPTVTFLDPFNATGDLNGDGVADAAVTLAENSGSSGVFVYLAAVLNQEGTPVNVATQLLGDRAKLGSLRVENGEILVNMLIQGPGDPFCCPSLEINLRYRLEGGELVEGTDYVGSYHTTLPAASSPGRDITLILSADGTLEMTIDYLNQEPPIVQNGTWEKQGDGSIKVTLTGQDRRTYPEPEVLYFRLIGGDLVAVIYDLSLYGSEGLTLQQQR